MKKRVGFVSNSSSCSFIIDKNEINKIKSAKIDMNKVNEWANGCATDDMQYDWNKDKSFYDLYHDYRNKYITQFNKLQQDVIDMKFKPKTNIMEYYKYPSEFRYLYKNKKIEASDIFSMYELGHYFKSSKVIRKYLYYNLYAEFLKILRKRSFKSLYSWIFAVSFEKDKKIYIGKMWRRDKSFHDVINRNRNYNKRMVNSIKKYNKINRLSNRHKFYHILDYLIGQDFSLSGFWSSNISSLIRSDESHLQDIVKFLKLYNKLLIPLCHALYNKIEKDVSNKSFYENEYSDGGGCGDTLPLAECGLLFDDIGVEYIRINHH